MCVTRVSLLGVVAALSLFRLLLIVIEATITDRQVEIRAITFWSAVKPFLACSTTRGASVVVSAVSSPGCGRPLMRSDQE